MLPRRPKRFRVDVGCPASHERPCSKISDRSPSRCHAKSASIPAQWFWTDWECCGLLDDLDVVVLASLLLLPSRTAHAEYHDQRTRQPMSLPVNDATRRKMAGPIVIGADADGPMAKQQRFWRRR